jgi:hypothetical protein
VDDSTPYDFRVEPQFLHRTLAAQAFGADETASLSHIADEVTKSVVANKVPDIRVAAVTGGLAGLEGKVATVRAGFYFRRGGSGRAKRVLMHGRIRVGARQFVQVEGVLDPARFEANSPHANLSGRTNALVVGVVQEVGEDESRVVLRPLLVGFPYYAPASRNDPEFSSRRPEIPYSYVEEFRLEEADMRRPPTAAELSRVFAMPERTVKEAFGQILGLSSVPKDHGGERSDLVAEVTVSGSRLRAAFAFKGPGGKAKPWTLHPDNMGLRGDQAIRLFHEPADIQVVQHCCQIAETVRHVMDALASMHGRHYMIIDGDGTARILLSAGLLLTP